MPVRRLVGIDLGIASRHSVRVLEADGQVVCRSVVRADAWSRWLAECRPGAGRGAGRARGWRWCLEPTGPAWMPIAVFFARRGHAVYRVSSAKAADLRKFLRRHAKRTGSTRRRWPGCRWPTRAGCSELELPGADAAALDRRVRACDRLTRAGREHKARIKDLVRQLMPMTPLTGDLGKADLAVLERYADPRALLAAGHGRADRADHHRVPRPQQGQARAAQWAGRRGGGPRAVRRSPRGAVCGPGRRGRHRGPAAARDPGRAGGPRRRPREAYRQADPGQLARSLPGFAEISAPVLAAVMGRPGRFRDGTRFKSYAGLAPRASETGETDRKGQPMTKAGPSLLRATMFRAADTARKHDPQLARIYYTADDRTRRHPPQGLLRRRRPPRPTGLHAVDAPRHPLRDLRHRRHARHPRAGQADHRRELDRPRGHPQTPPQPQDSGEGPSGGHTGPADEATPPAPDRRGPTASQSTASPDQPPASTSPPGYPPAGLLACPETAHRWPRKSGPRGLTSKLP